MPTPERADDSTPEPGPSEELGALAAGLRQHLARELDRGRRRLVAPVAPPEAGGERRPEPKAAAAETTTAVGTPAKSADSPPTSPLPAGSQAPRAAAAPAPAPSTSAGEPPTRAVARAAPDLEALRAAVAGCTACGLCQTRTQTVFADGNPRARVMFVGEAPGADEDRAGVPFVGKAGQLLSDIIAKGMGLVRAEDVYIANVLKCRPPENRDPEPEEKRLCTPFLERQIELVDPQILIPLGRHAAQLLLGSEAPMGKLRGQVHRVGGRAVVPTYHPAYLLRSPNMKAATWADIQLAMGELGLTIPERWRSRGPRPG
jgi:uracil-DNA glycosylase family 4